MAYANTATLTFCIESGLKMNVRTAAGNEL